MLSLAKNALFWDASVHCHSLNNVTGVKFQALSLADENEEASELYCLKMYRFKFCVLQFWINIAQVVSDCLRLYWYQIYLKTTNGPMPSLSRAWCPFPAGCKFLLGLVHMIGVTNNKKTF